VENGVRAGQPSADHGGMGWHLTDDVEEFVRATGSFLRFDRATNTIILTVVANLRERGPEAFGGTDTPVLGWWADGGPVQAAFVQTAPWPMATTALTDGQARELATAFRATGRTLPGVGGDRSSARAVADEWLAGTGRTARLQRDERLYRLAALRPPDPRPPGHSRPARTSDLDLVEDWFEAFGRVVGAAVSVGRVGIEDRLGYGGLTLWEVDGQPVSMGGCTRAVEGMARVGPIFTPAHLCGRGYGGAVTHAVAEALLAADVEEIVLYTDLANPTSNALYPRLGFEPVSDCVLLAFDGA